MANINVDTKSLLNQSNELSRCAKKVRTSSKSVHHVSKALSVDNDDAFVTISANLDRVSDSLLTEAAKMDSLFAALQHIAKHYSNTEKKIAGTALSKETLLGDAGSKRSNKEKSFFQKILDWLKDFFGWDSEGEKPTPEGVTREQEKAYDRYLQDTIFSLLDTDKYCRNTWNHSSIEERMDMLTAFLAELAAIYGVSVSMKIDWFDGDSDSRGYYDHDRKLVGINKNKLAGVDGYKITQTLIHEMRHAYQHSAVDDPDNYQVSKETIQQWRDNFAPGHYKSTEKGYTYEEYVSQPVEYDAKNFAKQYSDLANAEPEYTGSWD